MPPHIDRIETKLDGIAERLVRVEEKLSAHVSQCQADAEKRKQLCARSLRLAIPLVGIGASLIGGWCLPAPRGSTPRLGPRLVLRRQ